MVLYGDDKSKMENEEMIMFGYKTSYEHYDNLNKRFIPYYELWSSVNEITLTTKAWNSQKMREMTHENVENLIKTNERRIKKVIDKLIDPWVAIVVKQALKEINDLKDWLPTFEVLCNPGL